MRIQFLKDIDPTPPPPKFVIITLTVEEALDIIAAVNCSTYGSDITEKFLQELRDL